MPYEQLLVFDFHCPQSNALLESKVWRHGDSIWSLVTSSEKSGSTVVSGRSAAPGRAQFALAD
jgi:hypothetical protein